MKHLNKRLAGLLVVLMTASMLLAGCSSSELRLVKNTMDVSFLPEAQIKASAVFSIDGDALKKALQDSSVGSLSGATELNQILGDDHSTSLLDVASGHTFRLDFDGVRQYKDEGMKYSGTVGVSIDGTAPKVLGTLIMDGQQLVISSDLIPNVCSLLAETARNDQCTSLVVSEQFEKALRESFSGVEYVSLFDLRELLWMDVEVKAASRAEADNGEAPTVEEKRSESAPSPFMEIVQLAQQNPEEFRTLLNAASEFGNGVLSNYSTTLVQEVKGGQSFSGTLKQVGDALFNGADSGLKDWDQFRSHANRFNEEITSLLVKNAIWTSAEGQGSSQRIRDELASLANGSELRRSLRYMQGLFNTVIVPFEDSSVQYQITKDGSAFHLTGKAVFNWLGTDVAKLSVTSSMIPGTVNDISLPSKSILPIGELSSRIQEIFEQMNPVVEARVEWWPDEKEGADSCEASVSISYLRKEPFFQGRDDYDFTDGYLMDSQIYLPLRGIAEAFGDRVGYDRNVKAAYVEHDGAKISVPGIVRDGVTYVSLQDLGKIGYSVVEGNSAHGGTAVEILRSVK